MRSRRRARSRPASARSGWRAPTPVSCSASGPAIVEVPERIAVGADPSDIAVDDRWVWVANRGSSSVSRVDPYTGSAGETASPGRADSDRRRRGRRLGRERRRRLADPDRIVVGQRQGARGGPARRARRAAERPDDLGRVALGDELAGRHRQRARTRRRGATRGTGRVSAAPRARSPPGSARSGSPTPRPGRSPGSTRRAARAPARSPSAGGRRRFRSDRERSGSRTPDPGTCRESRPER